MLENVGGAQGDVDWRASLVPAEDMKDWTEQATHEVNGYTVPAPITEPLTKGQEYWLEMPTYSDWVWARPCKWLDDAQDQRWLERGLIHLTREAAVANAKARHGTDPEAGDD